MLVKKDYQFDARLKVPVDQDTPANRDLWVDTASGKLAFRIGDVDILIPLSSEIVGGGFSQEQIEDFVAAMFSDSSTIDVTYTDNGSSPGALDIAVLDSPKLEGNTLAQVQAAIISAISGGASAAYDTLIELEALIGTNISGIAALVTSVGARSRYYAGTVANGSPTATVTHGLNLTNIHDFIAKIFVSATGVEEEYAIVGATNNTATITDETGANIATGRRIFLTAGV